MTDYEKALEYVTFLGAEVVVVENLKNFCGDKIQGQWQGGKKIVINEQHKTADVLLHELGHMVAGRSCCREHEEKNAQAIAQLVAKQLHIKLTQDIAGRYIGFSKCPKGELT